LADDGSTCDASSTTLNGTLRYHETTFEGRTPDGWQPLGRTAFAAQGGTVTEAGGYRIHTFTSNGNLEVISDAGTVEVLVVGGGAGGGGRSGGGGGAGGLVYTSAIGVGAYQNITVQIGNGGSGGATSDSPGNDGANSLLSAGAGAARTPAAKTVEPASTEPAEVVVERPLHAATAATAGAAATAS
jgi:hypothetical protein